MNNAWSGGEIYAESGGLEFRSVANWPIVRPHNSKRAKLKVERPDTAAPELYEL